MHISLLSFVVSSIILTEPNTHPHQLTIVIDIVVMLIAWWHILIHTIHATQILNSHINQFLTQTQTNFLSLTFPTTTTKVLQSILTSGIHTPSPYPTKVDTIEHFPFHH